MIGRSDQMQAASDAADSNRNNDTFYNANFQQESEKAHATEERVNQKHNQQQIAAHFISYASDNDTHHQPESFAASRKNLNQIDCGQMSSREKTAHDAAQMDDVQSRYSRQQKQQMAGDASGSMTQTTKNTSIALQDQIKKMVQTVGFAVEANGAQSESNMSQQQRRQLESHLKQSKLLEQSQNDKLGSGAEIENLIMNPGVISQPLQRAQSDNLQELNQKSLRPHSRHQEQVTFMSVLNQPADLLQDQKITLDARVMNDSMLNVNSKDDEHQLKLLQQFTLQSNSKMKQSPNHFPNRLSMHEIESQVLNPPKIDTEADDDEEEKVDNIDADEYQMKERKQSMQKAASMALQEGPAKILSKKASESDKFQFLVKPVMSPQVPSLNMLRNQTDKKPNGSERREEFVSGNLDSGRLMSDSVGPRLQKNLKLRQFLDSIQNQSSKKNANEINLMYQPQQILNLDGASLADSSAFSGAPSMPQSLRNHLQAPNNNDDLAQLDKQPALQFQESGRNFFEHGIDQQLTSEQQQEQTRISNLIDTNNIELSQTGMNEDIKHLQNRIRDLELKIQLDNQELNLDSPGLNQKLEDPNVSFQSTMKNKIAEMTRDQQSEITINNIELESIAQKQDKVRLLQSQNPIGCDTNQSSAEFQYERNQVRKRLKDKHTSSKRRKARGQGNSTNVYKSKLDRQRHKRKYVEGGGGGEDTYSSEDMSQDADENDTYRSRGNSRLTQDQAQDEDNSSNDQIYKDQQDQQRYIQSDLDQTEPQPPHDQNWNQAGTLHTSCQSISILKQQEKLKQLRNEAKQRKQNSYQALHYKSQTAAELQQEESPNENENEGVFPLSDQQDAANLNVGLQGSYQSVKTLKPKAPQDSERMQQTFTFQNKRRKQLISPEEVSNDNIHSHLDQSSQIQNLNQKRIKLQESSKKQIQKIKIQDDEETNVKQVQWEKRETQQVNKTNPINDEQNQLEMDMKDTINVADIRPSRFDMLKRNNRNNFNQFQEFIEERELEDKIIQNKMNSLDNDQREYANTHTDSKKFQSINLRKQIKTASRMKYSQSVDQLEQNNFKHSSNSTLRKASKIYIQDEYNQFGTFFKDPKGYIRLKHSGLRSKKSLTNSSSLGAFDRSDNSLKYSGRSDNYENGLNSKRSMMKTSELNQNNKAQKPVKTMAKLSKSSLQGNNNRSFMFSLKQMDNQLDDYNFQNEMKRLKKLKKSLNKQMLETMKKMENLRAQKKKKVNTHRSQNHQAMSVNRRSTSRQSYKSLSQLAKSQGRQKLPKDKAGANLANQTLMPTLLQAQNQANTTSRQHLLRAQTHLTSTNDEDNAATAPLSVNTLKIDDGSNVNGSPGAKISFRNLNNNSTFNTNHFTSIANSQRQKGQVAGEQQQNGGNFATLQKSLQSLHCQLSLKSAESQSQKSNQKSRWNQSSNSNTNLQNQRPKVPRLANLMSEINKAQIRSLSKASAYSSQRSSSIPSHKVSNTKLPKSTKNKQLLKDNSFVSLQNKRKKKSKQRSSKIKRDVKADALLEKYLKENKLLRHQNLEQKMLIKKLVADKAQNDQLQVVLEKLVKKLKRNFDAVNQQNEHLQEQLKIQNNQVETQRKLRIKHDKKMLQQDEDNKALAKKLNQSEKIRKKQNDMITQMSKHIEQMELQMNKFIEKNSKGQKPTQKCSKDLSVLNGQQ